MTMYNEDVVCALSLAAFKNRLVLIQYRNILTDAMKS